MGIFFVFKVFVGCKFFVLVISMCCDVKISGMVNQEFVVVCDL